MIAAAPAPQISGNILSTANPAYAFAGAGVTAGDLLVTSISVTSSAVPTDVPTDTIQTTYVLAGMVSGNGAALWVYMGTAPATGANTVVYSLSASTASQISLLDAPGWNAAMDGLPVVLTTPTATTNPSVGPMAIAQASSLVVGFLRTASGMVSAGGGGSWTTRTAGGGSIQFLQPLANGSYTSAWTTASSAYSALVLAFLPLPQILQVQSSGTITSATPSFAYAQNVVQDDLLVNALCTTSAQAPTAVPTDTVLTNYVLIGSRSANGQSLWVYAGIAPASGPSTVRHTAGASAGFQILLVDALYWTINTDGTPVTNTGTATTSPSIGPLTTAQALSLVIGFLRGGAISAGGAGWTLRSTAGAGFQYQIPGVAGNFTALFTTASSNFSGVLAAFLAPVLAIVTNAASGVAGYSATLNGTINTLDQSGNAVAAGFNYGLTTAYGTSIQLGGSAFPLGAFSQLVSKLAQNTTYHFQAWATSANGNTVYGADQTFTTPVVPLITVTTGAASSVTPTGAQLGGNITQLDSSGNAIQTGFLYGPTTAYSGIVSQNGSFPVGAFSLPVASLLANTTYHFCAFGVSTLQGVTYGADQTFTTPAGLSVAMGSAGAAGLTTALLTGSIASLGAGGNATIVGFQYGLTTAYGSTASATGSFGVGGFNQSLSGLIPNTLYHYRVFATSPDGTAYSLDQTFFTPQPGVVQRATPVSFSGTQGQITFASPPTAGNGLQFDIFWAGGATITSVGDSQVIGSNPANTWAEQTVTSQQSIWTANKIQAGGVITLTVNFSAAVTNGWLVAREINGAHIGLDWQSNKTLSYGTGNPQYAPSITIAPGLPGELLIVNLSTTNGATPIVPYPAWTGVGNNNGQGSFVFRNPTVNGYTAIPAQLLGNFAVQLAAVAWIPLPLITQVQKAQCYLARKSGKRDVRGIVLVMPGDYPQYQYEAQPGLAYPGCSALMFRTFWNTIQPTNSSTYNTAALDYVLNVLCPKYNKGLVLSVGAGTRGTPSWLTGMEMLSFTRGVFPAPWDPVYQAAWQTFITWLGNRYDGNPYLGHIADIGASWGNQINFCTTGADNTAFYNGDAYGGVAATAQAGWTTAINKIIGFWTHAFPTTPLSWALGAIVYHNLYGLYWNATCMNFRINKIAVRNNGINANMKFANNLTAIPSYYSRLGSHSPMQEVAGGVSLPNFLMELRTCRYASFKSLEVYPGELNYGWIPHVQRINAEMNSPNWAQIGSTEPWIG